MYASSADRDGSTATIDARFIERLPPAWIRVGGRTAENCGQVSFGQPSLSATAGVKDGAEEHVQSEHPGRYEPGQLADIIVGFRYESNTQIGHHRADRCTKPKHHDHPYEQRVSH